MITGISAGCRFDLLKRRGGLLEGMKENDD